MDEGGFDWDNEAGEFDELLEEMNEAGFEAGEDDDDDDDDEAGEDWVVYEDEAGQVITAIPLWLDDEESEAGKRVRRSRRRRRRRGPKRPPRRGGRRRRRRNRKDARYRTASLKAFRELRSLVHKIAKRQSALMRRAPHGAEVANPTDMKGCRILLGNTLALAAPGAAGMGAWGPLAIQPAAGMRMTWLVIEIYEDTYAAVAAGNTLIPGLAVFDITAVQVAGNNIIRSNQQFVPGGMFQPTNTRLGFPLATGRDVDISGGSTVNLNGRVSPRAPAGASALDVTAAFVSPSTSGF